jgi:hypothetical protein
MTEAETAPVLHTVVHLTETRDTSKKCLTENESSLESLRNEEVRLVGALAAVRAQKKLAQKAHAGLHRVVVRDNVALDRKIEREVKRKDREALVTLSRAKRRRMTATERYNRKCVTFAEKHCNWTFEAVDLCGSVTQTIRYFDVGPTNCARGRWWFEAVETFKENKIVRKAAHLQVYQVEDKWVPLLTGDTPPGAGDEVASSHSDHELGDELFDFLQGSESED